MSIVGNIISTNFPGERKMPILVGMHHERSIITKIEREVVCDRIACWCVDKNKRRYGISRLREQRSGGVHVAGIFNAVEWVVY